MRVSPVLLSNPNLARRNFAKNQTNPVGNKVPKNALSNAQKINFGIIEWLGVAGVVLAGVAIDVGTIALLAMDEGETFDFFKGNKEYDSNSFTSSRALEFDEIKDEIEIDAEEIAARLNVSHEVAEKYLNGIINAGMLKPSKDGQEKGLNAVMGYGVEKYKLASDFLAPIILAQKNPHDYSSRAVPNGLLLFGPPGSGKTYIADKLCEHLQQFGVLVTTLELDPNDHDKNVDAINKAFEDAKINYKVNKKYTVINLKRDMDNFFMDRNVSKEYQKEVSALMYNSEEAVLSGTILLATANNPKDIDKALLRPGRIDVKMPIGNMKDFAIGDMIKYSLIKYGEEESTEYFDYKKVVQYVKDRKLDFTPSEYERDFVKQAVNKKHPDKLVTADDIISEIERYVKLGFITLDDGTMQRFKSDQDYLKELDDTVLDY